MLMVDLSDLFDWKMALVSGFCYCCSLPLMYQAGPEADRLVVEPVDLAIQLGYLYQV